MRLKIISVTVVKQLSYTAKLKHKSFIFSTWFLLEFWEPFIRSRTWSCRMVLYSPVFVENVWFIQSKLCSLHIFVLWKFMFNDGSGWWVWAWGCIMLYDCWWFESVFCLGQRKLLCCRHRWWDITLSDTVHLLVESRTRQLLLRVIVVVVKFIYSVSVAVELLSHRMMNSLLAKGGIFLVGNWRWRSDLLFTFVNDPLNVLLLNFLTRHSEWPAIGCLRVAET